MPHAVRGEARIGAVVEPDRQRQDDRLLGVPKPRGDEVRDIGESQCVLELGARLLVERRVPLEGRCMDGLRHGGEG